MRTYYWYAPFLADTERLMQGCQGSDIFALLEDAGQDTCSVGPPSKAEQKRIEREKSERTRLRQLNGRPRSERTLISSKSLPLSAWLTG